MSRSPPEHPESLSADWIEYTHPTLGYSIKYLFRFDNYPVLVINYVDEQEARDRGLWAKHKPVDSVMVDNQLWWKYVYTRCHFRYVDGFLHNGL